MFKLAWKLTKNLPRLAVMTAGAGVAWSAFGVDHSLHLPPPLPGDRTTLADAQGGFLALYGDETGSGERVLLVHSVNAAASSFEMRPLYTRLQSARPVSALDLPGYGYSERGNRPYSPVLMAGAIVAALERLGPSHVVALSLGAEFAARAAADRPDLFSSLALLSPTGFGADQGTPGWVGAAVRVPLWSQAAYDALTSRPVIRYYLQKSFAGPVDEAAVDYAYRTAHQPGARFAPFAFLAGELFTSDAPTSLYGHVDVPVVVLYDRDPFSGFEKLPEFLSAHPSWQATRIEGTAGLPHWDRPTETLEALESHWSA